MGVDTDAALDQAANAWSLMAMQVSAAAGRKGDAVAAHQQLAFRQGLKICSQLLMRIHAWRAGGGAALGRRARVPSASKSRRRRPA